jgi:pimeloyl-ACP methyl ester carboxylesterase
VLGRASRWPNNDTATIHELLLLDVAAGVRMLREEGCDKVILLGNSGGGSLAAFYQAQSTIAPPGRLPQTAAGDLLDLNRFDLTPAQGVAIVGGHVGQGLLLGKMIDASVVDESDPISADPDLDMYDPRNGFRVPPESSRYSDEFLARYRAAQLDRVRRLDAKARGMIGAQRDAADLATKPIGEVNLRLQREARIGWHMIIYRTTADPAFTDLSIVADDRLVFTYVGRQPHLENYGENGFARYVTPRAWLSTWSALSSRARTVDNLAQIREPLLIVHYRGDSGTRLSEVREMLARSGSANKQLHQVEKVDHYSFAILPDGTFGPRSTKGTDKVVSWMQEHFPV